MLSQKRHAPQKELVAHAFLIRGLQEAGTDRAMDLYCAADDCSGYIFHSIEGTSAAYHHREHRDVSVCSVLSVVIRKR